MGFLILATMGAIFGWLATVVAQSDSLSGIVSNVAAGAVGAVLIGEIGNPGSVLEGITGTALLLAVIGALLFISVANFVRSKV